MFLNKVFIFAIAGTSSALNDNSIGALALNDIKESVKVTGGDGPDDLQALQAQTSLLRGSVPAPPEDVEQSFYDYLDLGFLENVVNVAEEVTVEGCRTSGGCCTGRKCCTPEYTCQSCSCKKALHTPRILNEPCSAFNKCDTSKYYCTSSFKCANKPGLWGSCNVVKTCMSGLKCGDDFKCHEDPRRENLSIFGIVLSLLSLFH